MNGNINTRNMVRDLFKAAKAEPVFINTTESFKPDLKFDVDIDKPREDKVNPDDNWISRYPGQNCEHIGNGAGGRIS